MRVAAFFLYLCFLLMGGNDPVHAGYGQRCSYGSPEQTTKNRQAGLAGVHQSYQVFTDIIAAQERGYLIDDSVEDEDANDCFAKKCRLSDRFTPAYSYQSILSYLYSCAQTTLPFCGQVSPKYIVQRTLRI